MNVFFQILKVNELREGVGKASGREYRMRDAECVILNEMGQPEEVGVLMLSKDYIDTAQPGYYAGTFAMRANKSKEGGRRIEAVLVGMKPMNLTAKGFVPLDVSAKSPEAPVKAAQ